MSDVVLDQVRVSLGDAYTIVRELGGGGMSRVFLARDESLGRDVVLKLLMPELASTLSAERFTREIRTVASLQEPHIVPVLAAGQTADGLPWFTMPYVSGESLRARLARGPVAASDALGILRNVAQALAHAHARGVVHRDIKPDNVLLSSGTAVVADFGIAKAVSASRTLTGASGITQAGMAVGTPAYMAPEQATGDPGTDHRADVYAWGVLAYELLGGAHPFAARKTPSAMTAAHIAEVPASLAADGVSAGVRALVMRALEKDPAHRPATMDEVLATLAAESTPGAVTPQAAQAATLVHAGYPRAPLIALVLGVLVIGGGAMFMMRARANGERMAAAAADKASVAVLPFTDLSAGRGNEYFGDGIAETLISALGHVAGLDVAARTSAFSFRGRNVDVREIGSKLGVSTVLEGSVQRAGDKLRITAQLVKASDGVSLWSETFDRSATDIFAVQDEVARAVISALKGRVLAARSVAAPASTRDPEAYDLYLQGRFHQAKRTASDVQQAIALFTRSIERDTNFVQAWAGLADGYIVQALYQDVPARATLDKANGAVQRALAQDPENGEALTTRAYLLTVRDWNWAAADTAFQHALRVSPGYALAHKWYGDVHGIFGRADDELREYLRAWQLDPLSGVIAANVGQHYEERGDTVQMLAWIDRSLALDPTQPLALRALGPTLVARGDSARFFDVHRRLAAGTAIAGAPESELRAAWRRGGAHAVAEAQVAAFDRAKQPFESARWNLVAGNTDAAFHSLDRAYAERASWMPFFKNYLNRPAIRRDPRYRALVKRMGMPEEAP